MLEFGGRKISVGNRGEKHPVHEEGSRLVIDSFFGGLCRPEADALADMDQEILQVGYFGGLAAYTLGDRAGRIPHRFLTLMAEHFRLLIQLFSATADMPSREKLAARSAIVEEESALLIFSSTSSQRERKTQVFVTQIAFSKRQ